MAITVKSITHTPLCFEKIEKHIYQLSCPGRIDIFYTKNKIDYYKLSVHLKENFKCDGASVPPIFNWFLPRWNNKNMLYNCASIIHDCLYTLKGNNEYYSRSEADDFLRGIWRNSGISRFRAGVGDMCVGIFGNCNNHWGDDDLDNVKNNLIKLYVEKV